MQNFMLVTMVYVTGAETADFALKRSKYDLTRFTPFPRSPALAGKLIRCRLSSNAPWYANKVSMSSANRCFDRGPAAELLLHCMTTAESSKDAGPAAYADWSPFQCMAKLPEVDDLDIQLDVLY